MTLMPEMSEKANGSADAVDSADIAERLTLDDLTRCYEGGIPAVMCTTAGGVPNITYVSRVHQVDAGRVAISNQFMSKTSRNIAVNPRADLLLIDPVSHEEYRLALRFERTERRGPVFERLRDDVAELAELMGLEGVFRLRAADIYRVTDIERVGHAYPERPREGAPARSMTALVEFTERVSRVGDLAALVDVTIDGLDRVLGYHHVSLFLLDESGTSLYTIASRGFDHQNVGAEVALGEGPIGGPLARCEVLRSTGLRQLSKYSRAIRTEFDAYGVRPGLDVPVPTLSDVESRIVVPMRALGQLVGGIVVEHREIAMFDPTDEQMLTVAAATLANAIEQARLAGVLEPGVDRDEQPVGSAPIRAATPSAGCTIRYFNLDGSAFIDGDYVIKGVAGRILRSLVIEHLESGRTAFTNRELRLDQTLDLPGFKDNLESRLLLLTRRLDERGAPLRITRTGRGRFALDVQRALTLEIVDDAPT